MPLSPILHNGNPISFFVDQAGMMTQAIYLCDPADPVTILGTASAPLKVDGSATTQPISGTVSIGNFPTGFLAGQSGSWTVAVNNFPATQPISAASLPLPAGAAAETTLAALNAKVSAATAKGTQGANGLPTQDLKDAGRAIVNAATAIAGVTTVTTEALLTLAVSRDGASPSNVTSISVTSGKRYRITAIVAGIRSTAAAVLSGRISLRMNPTGAATATSPILVTLPLSQQATALAQAGDTVTIPIPDGIEISGTQQVGLSQVCSAVTGLVNASVIGYEY